MAAVRRNAGDDFVVGLKWSAEEGVPGGLTLDRTLEIIPLLERTGRLDYFLISMGGFGNIEFIHPTTHYGLSPFVHCAAAVKKVSKLPVIAVGKIKFALEEVLREGKADLVAMARPLICDPDLPVKIMEKRQDEIRSCLSCNECHATHLVEAIKDQSKGESQLPSRLLFPGAAPAGRSPLAAQQFVEAARAGTLFHLPWHHSGPVRPAGSSSRAGRPGEVYRLPLAARHPQPGQFEQTGLGILC